MRKFGKALLASMMMAAVASTPALANEMKTDKPMGGGSGTAIDQPMTQERTDAMDMGMGRARADAFVTVAPTFTYTIEVDRQAAVAYMDDALVLMDLAEDSLRAGSVGPAKAELIGASGKLTEAQLLLFKDRQFSDRIAPLALRAQEAFDMASENPERAASIIAEVQPQVASLYDTQLATMGGGAGTGMMEDLNYRQNRQMNQPVEQNELNQPMDEELEELR